MERIALQLRNTYSYAPGWSHLDEWSEDLGHIRVTPPKLIREPSGWDDGGTYVRFARVPRSMAREKVCAAVSDTLSWSRCRHEHDCCGCASHSTSAKFLSNRLLRIETTVSYNY